MTERELRLECLRLAVWSAQTPSEQPCAGFVTLGDVEIVARAEAFYAFASRVRAPVPAAASPAPPGSP